jgi:hypothetical protein
MAMSKLKRSESGAAMIEGAFSSLLFVPLLLGTLFFGSEFVTTLQAVQVTRDAGHMFARGVNFTTSATASNQILLARLGQQLGLATFDAGGNVTGVNTTGPMVVTITAIQNVSPTACQAMNGTTTCPNVGMWVVTQQVIIGNSTLRISNYTQNPLPAGEMDAITGKVLTTTSGSYTYPYYLSDTKFQLRNFNLIPISDAAGFPHDTSAYMAESFMQTPGVPGFIGGGGIYTHTIF